MLAAFVAVLLTSCTSTTGPEIGLGNPSFTGGPTTVAGMMEEVAREEGASLSVESGATTTTVDVQASATSDQPAQTEAQGDAAVADQAEPTLPAEVAMAPSARPEAARAAAEPAQPAVEATASTDEEAEAVQVAAAPVSEKKRGFLASFFAPSRPAAAAAQPTIIQDVPVAASPAAPAAATATAAVPSPTPTAQTPPLAEPKPLVAEKAPMREATRSKPLVQLASTGPARAAAYGPDGGLPGVRTSALFEITRKSGMDDDVSDIDLHEDYGPSVRVASAAGLARLAPNGLRVQREDVDVACLKPSLVRVLKTVERRFGRALVVTSGYRSPTHNRRVRGARNSMHMYCAAADVQVPGVSKWQLAEFVRTLPGRGGVGTYCHTESVHIDVGPERDWNWRCRRRKG